LSLNKWKRNMKQLSGLDSSFLYSETNNAPMHISTVSILDPSTAPGGKVRFKEIIEHIKGRLHLADYYRQKVVRVPFDADFPYWVNDEHFDPEYHIRHYALPAPGDWRQFCILLARINSRGLDLTRPLWEAYVIEGLDNIEGMPKGCFALLTKNHHAAIDGTSSAEIGATLCDTTNEAMVLQDDSNWAPQTVPSDYELLTRAHFNNLMQPMKFMELIQKSIPVFSKAMDMVTKGEIAAPGDVPKTRFNDAVSQHRIFEGLTFSLAEMKSVRALVAGVTVNDVIVTVVGGGMRRYLEAKSELPTISMVAQCPINVRDDSDKVGGNQIATMSVEMGTHISDAVERLLHVHTSTSNGKRYNQAIGAKTMTDFTNATTSNLMSLGAKVATENSLANQLEHKYNCVITNVPGPQIPLYIKGAKILGGWGLGPIMNGNGLFHTVGSYCGEVNLGISACRVMMPDPSFYRECLQASYDELIALVAEKQSTLDKQSVTAAKTATAKPIAAETATVKPTAAKTATVKPTAAKTTTAKPIAAKTATAKPTAAKTATVKPTAAKTATAKPTEVKPATSKPVAVNSATAKPAVTQLDGEKNVTIKSSRS
jgi:WS/DGAT/MGAT family acyltransferase